MPIAAVEGANTSTMTKIGFGQRDSEQGLLKGEWLTMMDSDRRLCCLSLNLALKFIVMSSFFSYSQTMRSTTSSTPIFGLVMAIEKDEDG